MAERMHRRGRVLGVAVLGVMGLGVGAARGGAMIRMATYNTDISDTGSITPPAGMGTIFQGMGSLPLNGQARPIDVLTLTELNQDPVPSLTGIVNQLNAIYGAGTYAYDPLVGQTDGGGSNGPSGLVYNTKTVQVIGAEAIGPVSGSGAPRQPMRYEIRPVGYGADADFYVYVDHMKASSGGTNPARRNIEAQEVRADADALGPSAHVIYTGDYNLVSGSSEPAYQTMIGAGAGQAVDVVDPTNTWKNNAANVGILTESATNLTARFDVELQTDATLHQAGLQYVAGTYTVFGNNGTTSFGGSVDTAGNTSLNALANRAQLLSLLTTVSDHLPVMADYQEVGVSPVPEPGLAGVVLLGLAGVMMGRRGRMGKVRWN